MATARAWLDGGQEILLVVENLLADLCGQGLRWFDQGLVALTVTLLNAILAWNK